MFASFVLERDPLGLKDVKPLFFSWVQDAGGFAAFAILLWLLFGFTRMRSADRERVPAWQAGLFTLFTLGAALLYGVLAVLRWPDIRMAFVTNAVPFSYTRGALYWQEIVLTAAGGCA